MDDVLNWNGHTQSLSASISYKLSILSRLSKTAPSSLLDIVCKTCIQPTTDYGCTIWGNSSNSNKNMIHRLQKGAARIVTGNSVFLIARGDDYWSSEMANFRWESEIFPI